ncbi:MAG: DUF2782 domain-containing protein [Gammaproteobacteria bacterium]|nr:DUF2782 domain-containing protein [Gammaproteobacteria bacterium]
MRNHWKSERFREIWVRVFLALMLPGVLLAEESTETLVIPADAPFEPGVRIYEKSGDQIEEYSINGRIYKIKITPQIGPAYYLIDEDGDGELESRFEALKSNPPIPQWVLFRW